MRRFHHTEKTGVGKVEWKFLAPKDEWKDSETKPGKKSKKKHAETERQLKSFNNKHAYIFRGRYV